MAIESLAALEVAGMNEDLFDVVVKSDGSAATAVQYTDALIKLL